MLATAKHFPGHGDTGTDSHLALPVIASSWSRLDSVELVPFRAAIAAGVDAVMSAHIALPGDQRGRAPARARCCPNVLTGILRDSLGFKGIVVTDALNMAGVANAYGAGAAVRAFLAGADLLLQPADPKAAIDAMAAAVERGEITKERLDRSVLRLLEAKKTLGLFRRRTVSLDSLPGLRRQRRVSGRGRHHGGALDRDGEGRGRHRARTQERSAAAGVDRLRRGRQSDRRRAPSRPSCAPPGSPSTSSVSGPGAARPATTRPPPPWPRGRVAVFATADRPIAGRGTIGLPEPADRADILGRAEPAHHPDLAGKSVSYLESPRSRLLSHRLARELRDRAGGGARAGRQGGDHRPPAHRDSAGLPPRLGCHASRALDHPLPLPGTDMRSSSPTG